MTAATRYAQALFELAEDAGQLPALAAPMVSLAEVLEDETLRRALENPKLTPAHRLNLARAIAADIKAPPLLAKTLSLLAHNNRLLLLPEVLDACLRLAEEKEGILRLAVQTAEPLSDDQRKHLKTVVLQQTGSAGVIIHETTQPNLIAGFRATFGGMVWDTSVANGLARLRHSFTKRFQHTI
jgi:F-type H+-transporting ATPase subunit delta